MLRKERRMWVLKAPYRRLPLSGYKAKTAPMGGQRQQRIEKEGRQLAQQLGQDPNKELISADLAMRPLGCIYHTIVSAIAPLRVAQLRDLDASSITFARFSTEASLGHDLWKHDSYDFLNGASLKVWSLEPGR